MSFVMQNSPRLFNFDCVLKPEAIEGAFKKNAKHKRKPNKQKEKKRQTDKQTKQCRKTRLFFILAKECILGSKVIMIY